MVVQSSQEITPGLGELFSARFPRAALEMQGALPWEPKGSFVCPPPCLAALFLVIVGL